MNHEVFLDTAYAIALANVRDALHPKAVQVAQDLRAQQTKLVTTQGRVCLLC